MLLYIYNKFETNCKCDCELAHHTWKMSPLYLVNCRTHLSDGMFPFKRWCLWKGELRCVELLAVRRVIQIMRRVSSLDTRCRHWAVWGVSWCWRVLRRLSRRRSRWQIRRAPVVVGSLRCSTAWGFRSWSSWNWRSLSSVRTTCSSGTRFLLYTLRDQTLSVFLIDSLGPHLQWKSLSSVRTTCSSGTRFLLYTLRDQTLPVSLIDSLGPHLQWKSLSSVRTTCSSGTRFLLYTLHDQTLSVSLIDSLPSSRHHLSYDDCTEDKRNK